MVGWISHWGFNKACIEIGQVRYDMVVVCGPYFPKESILSGPVEACYVYVHEDMLHFIVERVSVTTRWASVDYGEGLLNGGVEDR